MLNETKMNLLNSTQICVHATLQFQIYLLAKGNRPGRILEWNEFSERNKENRC